MSSVPAAQRGAASGVRERRSSTPASSLSIGIFFSLMIIGLAHTLPVRDEQRTAGSRAYRRSVAHDVANLPPVGSLFAAFLGYNPIAELLAPSGALQHAGRQRRRADRKTFFPQLITEPFHTGLVVVFIAAAVMMVIGADRVDLQPGRYADAPGADNEA